MMTVNEVSKRTGVSVRTLHYYDQIGLLHPCKITQSHYRLYDDAELERLQHILLFRELEFPLKEIKEILNCSSFDRQKALEQQIMLLQLKKEHLDNLIDLALGIKMIGVKKLDFKAFDTSKIDEYAAEAKSSWGQTDAYKENEEKFENYSKQDIGKSNILLMQNFVAFGMLLKESPESEAAQNQVKTLQNTITANFYNCTNEILSGLGQMYTGDGRFVENIDKAGGKGTAEFVGKAIEYYCANSN